MLKKFNHFIKENVDVLDPAKTMSTQKPKNGNERYIMIFIVKDDKIVNSEKAGYYSIDDGGDIMLFDIENLRGNEHYVISNMYLTSNFNDGLEVYKVEIQKEFVDAARKQTGLELKIGEVYRLPEDQPLYTWLLENIDVI